MKKNKLILFDWGGIVESHDIGYTNRSAWNDLLAECNPNTVDISKISYYDLTSIPTEDKFREVYEQMKKDIGLKVEFDEFIDKYIRIFDKVDYYPEVRDYEISLRDKCYIGILSNLNMYDKKRMEKQLGLGNYDYVFLSFELACRKPNVEIFEKVQEKLPFDKKDILFIDDKLNNINAAKEFGWNAVQSSGLELDRIKEECEGFINKEE